MRIYSKLVLIVVLVLFIYFLVYFTDNLSTKNENKQKMSEMSINIAVVVCGPERVDESLVMMKSALLFSTKNTSINFIIVTEPKFREIFEQKMENFVDFPKFSYEIFHLKFPNDDQETWLKLFKPCASQRLFLPSLLPHHDSILYVDCDVIFLSSPDLVYQHFKSFDESQMSAMASESENFNTGWYTRFARHPFYQPFGVNSGVMLMNLTRMRNVNFEDKIQPIYQKYRNKLAWGDQDILNIYFHEHPHEMHLMKCEYNYRPDHCMYTSQCDISSGVKVLHGNRGYFHKEGKQRIFREFYKAIEECEGT
ncbi:glucoside xylosyltransferase 2 isoform X2 [Chironomus tepperi]|uniref:glucoside xylosyltransferase 2 isoform X2 n=1 Tax=Chironomus tepperi TaxID=113505 RepID=UPI00391F486B